MIEQTVLHYRILRKLGAGGMGEVYLAQDTRLDRKIALKLLPQELTSKADRLRRFTQEARAASALNHPNIITIHEIGSNDAIHFIATEYIEGETLRDYLKHAQISFAEALDIAAQVAGALAAAHQAGIIHRDIKPENIMRRPDGIVKVLDFGLAKLAEKPPDAANDTTAPTRVVNTDPGTLLGTVQYMSPEQARGLATDERTDIWSLGCVLYEMVAGRPPFTGQTTADLLADIIKAPPAPLTRFASDVPAKLEEIVAKALEKDREERYQSVKDMLVDLRRLKKRLEFAAEMSQSPELPLAMVADANAPPAAATRMQLSAATDDTPAARTASSAEVLVSEIKRHKVGAAIALGVILLLVAGLGYGVYRFTSPKKTTAHFEQITITRLTTLGNVDNLTISPDGKFISYTLVEGDKRSLWTKYLPTGSTVQIVAPAKFKFLGGNTFSPDGNFIFYALWNDEYPSFTIFQTPVLGGASRKIIDNVTSPACFSPDGKQLAVLRWEEAGRAYELTVANVDGSGAARVLATKSRNQGEWFTEGGPAWSPDGKLLAIGAGSNEGGPKTTVVGVAVDTGQITRLTNQDWANVGRIAWFSDGSGFALLATDLEASNRNQIWQVAYPGGEVRRITGGVNLNEYGDTLAITADNKRIAALYTENVADLWVVPTSAPDRAHAQQVTARGQQDNGDRGLAWTADGRLVYTSIAAGNGDIWIMKADGSGQKQLNDDPHDDWRPVVATDDRTVVFVSARTGSPNLWRMSVDGGNLKQLTDAKVIQPPSITPDGRWVLYSAPEGDHVALFKVSVDGGEPVHVATLRSVGMTSVSPDGQLVACGEFSHENGVYRQGIAVLRLEDGQLVKRFASPSGSYLGWIGWSPDGRALICSGPKTWAGPALLWRQPLDGGPSTVFADFSPESVWAFAFSRDGKQLALSLGHETKDAVLINDAK